MSSAVTKTSIAAREKGSLIIKVDCTKEDDTELTPKTFKWSLVDTYDGAVVNSRERVSETPASTVYIALSGDDLAILHDGAKEERELVVEITYDSVYGDDTPQNDAIRFDVINLRYLPGA
jgi:hypothetical protein